MTVTCFIQADLSFDSSVMISLNRHYLPMTNNVDIVREISAFRPILIDVMVVIRINNSFLKVEGA